MVVGLEADPEPRKRAATTEHVPETKKSKGEVASFVDVHKEGK